MAGVNLMKPVMVSWHRVFHCDGSSPTLGKRILQWAAQGQVVLVFRTWKQVPRVVRASLHRADTRLAVFCR